MKRKYIKLTAGLTAVVMSAGMTYWYADSRNMRASDTSEVYTEEEYSEDIRSFNSSSEITGVTKSETVYVNASATGSAEKITVSDWLTGSGKDGMIYDISDLDNIQNIKGDEEYTANGRDLVWRSEGSDICYQGTSDSELPVDMKITYTLNGKTVTPEELAGKSGKVTIRFDYSSKEKRTVSVGGKDRTVNIPFAAVSGLMLDSDRFSDVRAVNGKIVSDGNRYIVIGGALCGVSESLSSESDISDRIPSYFEIEANTSSFAVSTTLTVFSNELFSSIDTASTDTEELSRNIDTLTGSSSDLKNGASDLYNGIHELLEKTGDLTSGVSALGKGASDLSDGSSALSDGSVKLENGVNDLKNGIGQLSAGIRQLSQNSEMLRNGSGEFSKALEMLNDRLDSLSSDTSDLEMLISASSGIKNGISDLNKGSSELCSALSSEAMRKKFSSEGLDTEKLTEANKKSIETINSQISVLNSQLEQIKNAEGYATQKEQINAQIASLSQTAELIAVNSAYIEASQKYIDTAGKAAEQITSGLSGLYENYVRFDGSISVLADKIVHMTSDLEELKNAVTVLCSSYSKIDSAVYEYTSGVDTVNSKSDLITAGAADLNNGASELRKGMDTLSDGVSKLKSGVSDLNAGTDKLADGIEKLDEGSCKLSSGMDEFDKEGIGMIGDIFRNNIVENADILSALCMASESYRSYSGISDEMDGNVKFVFETDGIG